MIDKKEILKIAESLNLRADIVEKDYILGWLLAGISAHKNLSQNLIFKGGTCLKKCHLETHRLSEDLDYTVLDKKYVDVDFLVHSFKTVSDWVYENSDIEMPNFKSIKAHKKRERIISFLALYLNLKNLFGDFMRTLQEFDRNLTCTLWKTCYSVELFIENAPLSWK